MRQQGADQEALEDKLDEEESEEIIPLEEMIPNSWEMGEPLEPFPVAVKAPAQAQTSVRRHSRRSEPGQVPNWASSAYPVSSR
jgi:hypothetical protein